MTQPTFLVRNAYNAQKEMISVYDKDGNETKVSRLNARDLLNMGYATRPPSSGVPSPAAARATAAAVEPVIEETPVVEPTPVIEDTDTEMKSLSAMAVAVTGEDNVEAFLNTYTKPGLRALMESRYGVKPSPAAKEQKLISDILALEEERIDNIPAWMDPDDGPVQDEEDQTTVDETAVATAPPKEE